MNAYLCDHCGQWSDSTEELKAEIAQLRAERDLLQQRIHEGIRKAPGEFLNAAGMMQFDRAEHAEAALAALLDGLQAKIVYWEKAQHAQTRGAESSSIGSIERDTFRSSASLIASILYTLKPLLGWASAGKEPQP